MEQELFGMTVNGSMTDHKTPNVLGRIANWVKEKVKNTYSRMYPGSCINLFKPASNTLCATYKRILPICYNELTTGSKKKWINYSKLKEEMKSRISKYIVPNVLSSELTKIEWVQCRMLTKLLLIVHNINFFIISKCNFYGSIFCSTPA